MAHQQIKENNQQTNIWRQAWFWKHHPPEPDGEINYIEGLYLKSDWEPDPCQDEEIEDALIDFASKLATARSAYNKISPTNILPKQWRLIEEIKDNDLFICIEADKNCGGCILLRDTNNSRGMSEHLGNRAVYKPLTEHQALIHHRKLKSQVVAFYTKWRAKRVLSKAEFIYLSRAVDYYADKIARFRMSLKAHKTPWKMRPIVCCVGTFMNCLSCWLDYWFQKLKHLIPTYIRDSKQLLTKLQDLQALPPNARLFTADANSMYTNIDTDHAIEVITQWLRNLEQQNLLPVGFPTGAIIEAMELVMRNNLFEWGDMYFLQLLGTAMGTSSACMWATIYFAVHEMGKLIPTYSSQLLLFLRFIDDMIAVWIGTDQEYEQFKNDTNNFGILTWEFEPLSKQVDFLDLTVSIENNKITTKTYQKSINLYQYIPPYSAHPPGMIKGIIYGLLRTYHLQNTYKADYLNMATLLYHRHVARGWDRATIKLIILEADIKVRQQQGPQPTTPQPIQLPQPPLLQTQQQTNDTLYLHWEFHPNDIPRRRIRAIYNACCADLFQRKLDIEKLIIAYSRPPNIKDLLTKAKLHQAPGHESSKYYKGELP